MHAHRLPTVPLEGAKEMLAAAKRDFADHIPSSVRAAAALYLHTYVPAHIKRSLEYVAHETGYSVIEVMLANLVYELSSGVGCTSLSISGVHCRNLDWYFPGNLLQDHTTVWIDGLTRKVTWPGMVGVFTGMRKFAFSISLNAVSDPTDTPAARAGRILRGAEPAAWVIERVLRECQTYEQAKKELENALLISPCLFTLTGAKVTEGCVIQKLADGSVLPHNGPYNLCTNDYDQSVGSGAIHGFLGSSSCSRYQMVKEKLDEFKATGAAYPTQDVAMEFISGAPVCNAITAHQVIMHPATDRLWVSIPGQFGGFYHAAHQGD